MSEDGIGDEDVDCPGDTENEADAKLKEILNGDDFTGTKEEAESLIQNHTIDLTNHQLLTLYIKLKLPERVKSINIEYLSKKQLEHFKEFCHEDKELIDAVSYLQMKRSQWKANTKKPTKTVAFVIAIWINGKK